MKTQTPLISAIQQRHYRQVLLLISLLLFLPLTQAEHLNQHQNISHDVQCELYHSIGEHDDFNGQLDAPIANNAIELPYKPQLSAYHFCLTTLANIRAPPLNHK
jgi:hypothetical protein